MKCYVLATPPLWCHPSQSGFSDCRTTSGLQNPLSCIRITFHLWRDTCSAAQKPPAVQITSFPHVSTIVCFLAIFLIGYFVVYQDDFADIVSATSKKSSVHSSIQVCLENICFMPRCRNSQFVLVAITAPIFTLVAAGEGANVYEKPSS